jgi:hypothetical protein
MHFGRLFQLGVIGALILLVGVSYLDMDPIEVPLLTQALPGSRS